MAILCDAKSSWRPTRYAAKTPGSAVQFDFTAVKLLDYQTQWAQLEASRNPFAIVVMAHLKTQEIKRDASDRQAGKFILVKRLYELSYTSIGCTESVQVYRLGYDITRGSEAGFLGRAESL